MAQESTSPVKHTPAGEMPDSSASGEAARRFEADLPLLSDPGVQRWLGIFLGAVVLGIGSGIYFLKKRAKH